MNPETPPDRCRLVLIAPAAADAATFPALLARALAGGDVASLILPQYGREFEAFQALAEAAVPVAQASGAAVVIAGDSRVAGRARADGLHVEGGRDVLDDAVARNQGRMIVGVDAGKTRDEALERGEARPDYVFFGRFGYDNQPAPHPRNLTLATWWAEMIEIPCIVLGGSAVESVEAVAASGAEFVALERAVFGEGADPEAAVRRANDILDRAAAPRLAEPAR